MIRSKQIECSFSFQFQIFQINIHNFTMKSILKLSQAVESALKQNKPVVALESTIITHGMEYPINL